MDELAHVFGTKELVVLEELRPLTNQVVELERALQAVDYVLNSGLLTPVHAEPLSKIRDHFDAEYHHYLDLVAEKRKELQ